MLLTTEYNMTTHLLKPTKKLWFLGIDFKTLGVYHVLSCQTFLPAFLTVLSFYFFSCLLPFSKLRSVLLPSFLNFCFFYFSFHSSKFFLCLLLCFFVLNFCFSLSYFLSSFHYLSLFVYVFIFIPFFLSFLSYSIIFLFCFFLLFFRPFQFVFPYD